MPPPAARTFTAALLFLLSSPALADSWVPPTTQKVKSANRKFVAVLDPVRLSGEGPRRPRITVRDAGAPDDAPPLWGTDLSNPVSPCDVMVSDDGRHVVTFDNWHEVGFGADVVAFYVQDENRGRQVARYALEQILSAEEIARATHTVSSRLWRMHGYKFFDDVGGATVLVLWLGRPGRWLAWDAATGRPLDPAADARALAQRVRNGADWSMRELTRDNGDRFGAVRFLAATKYRTGPKVFEKMLDAADFQTAHQLKSADDPGFWLAFSQSRKNGDRGLSEWNREPAALATAGDEYADWQYVRLGTLTANVRLPEATDPKAGHFSVYLVSVEVGAADWAAAKPVHVLRSRPDARRRQAAELCVRLEGVTPGRYWLKAVYDRRAPFGKGNDWRRPGPGDLESTDRRVVDVKAGIVTEYGTVACDREVSGIN